MQTWRLAEKRPTGTLLADPLLLLSSPRLRDLSGDPRWLVDEVRLPGTTRPLALDVYAGTVLRRMLETHASADDRVLVLGGALGLSCASEWARLSRALAGHTWLYLPGGGDGHAGAMDPPLGDADWQRACAAGEPAGAMAKDALVLAYLAHLGSLPLGAPRRVGRSGPWQSLDTKDAFLLELQWEADAEAPWRSYLTQFVDLSRKGQDGPRVLGVLLDTDQYDAASDAAGGTAGETNSKGNMNENQIAVVAGWLSQRREPGITLLMGHHAIEDLDDEAREAIEGWLDRDLAALYISAGSRAESFEEHQGSARRWLEVGVGSVVDWPLAMRSVAVRAAEDASAVALESRRLGPPASWIGDPLAGCEPSWRESVDNPDFERSYAALSGRDTERAAHRLIDALLWHQALERRLFAEPPDNALQERIRRTAGSFRPLEPKIALLAELTASPFETSEAEAAGFSDCQAQWALQRQRALVGVPDADEALLLLPVR